MENMSGSSTIEIEGHLIGKGQPCFIIAEIGVNHNGDPGLAKATIDAIRTTGVDCVKFQTFSADEFVSPNAADYEYISQGIQVKESMRDMFKRLELDRSELSKLFEFVREANMVPLSTPADRDAVDLLDEIGVMAYKVGSDDLIHIPLISYIASRGKPIILSTGMAYAEDIDRAIKAIELTGNESIALLHCVSQYPTPESDVNLAKIIELKKRYQRVVGFSDHSVGINASVGAVALGASIIERHVTLDHSLPGPDHRFSLDPDELIALVKSVREVEAMIGSSKLIPTEAERKMADECHRSIVAKVDLCSGDVINEENISYMRPGGGLPPYEINKVIGKVLRSNVPAGSYINLDNLDSMTPDNSE